MYVNGLIKGAMQESYQSNWYKSQIGRKKCSLKNYILFYIQI